MNRRGFLGRLASATLLAPVALVTATGPALAQGQTRPGAAPAALVLGDGARIEDTLIPEDTRVVIGGNHVVFQGNVMVGGGITVAGLASHVVIANNMIRSA